MWITEKVVEKQPEIRNSTPDFSLMEGSVVTFKSFKTFKGFRKQSISF